MKQSTLTTNKLAITYLVISLVMTIIRDIPNFGLLPESLIGSMRYLVAATVLIPGVIMLGVVMVDMIKLHQVDWRLLIITLCTCGVGAALYPMWGKVTALNKEIRNVLNVAVVLMLAKFILGFLNPSYSFELFSLRNDWVPYIGWAINLGAVVYGAMLLRVTNCKHTITWIFTLGLTLFQVNFGLLMILLFVVLYGKHHPGKNPIIKYIILGLCVCIVSEYTTGYFSNLVMHLENSIFLNILFIINGALHLAIIVLLIFDAIKLPVKGKVWRLLPALFSTTYSLIAIQDTEEQNLEQQ